MDEKITFPSVISNRGFLNLWINQILVQLSYNALNFSLIIWVFRLTQSALSVSLLMAAISLPAVIFGLFTGIFVDITDRKKIIMAIDLLLSLCFFSLIFFKISFLAVLAITFLVNTLAQFYGPAEASAIPLIVKKEQLLAANSLFSMTLYGAFLLGFGFSGPLINLHGIDFVFQAGGLILALAFLLSFSFPSIKAVSDYAAKRLTKAIKQRDFTVIKAIGWGEMLDTIRLIRGKLVVSSSIIILAAVQMVIGVLAVLIPGFLEQVVKIKATDASYVLVIPLGLGIATGGLVIAKMKRFIRRKLVGRGIILVGILFLLVGLAPVISPAISYFGHRSRPLSFITQPSLSTVLVVGSFLLGIAVVSILVPSQTVLQENTPEQDRGKVFSVLGVAMAAFSLIPILLVGILADLFGIHQIFLGLGLFILLVGLFALRPSLFFSENSLPFNIREFLGLGHWERKN